MTVYKLKKGTVFYGNGCIKECMCTCMCTCMCVRRGAGEGLRLLHFTDQKYLSVKSRLRSKNKCNCEVSFCVARNCSRDAKAGQLHDWQSAKISPGTSRKCANVLTVKFSVHADKFVKWKTGMINYRTSLPAV